LAAALIQPWLVPAAAAFAPLVSVLSGYGRQHGFDATFSAAPPVCVRLRRRRRGRVQYLVRSPRGL